jgi:predicted phage terminase large subunit-like protein
LDKENTANADQMQKTLDWFNLVLKPCLVPGGIIIYIGTRWAEGDLAEHLMTEIEKGGKGWPFYIVSAFVKSENGEPRLDENGMPISYWHDRWPVSALLHEQIEMGSADFAIAYLNDLSLRSKGNVFPKLAEHYYFTELPEGDYTIKMGIDLASSEKESADYTARVVTAVDQNGHFWVLHAYRDRRETDHAEFVADGFAAFPQVVLVIVENNQFQSTLVQQVMRDYSAIPIEGRKTDTDKVSRARAVAAKYEAHRVHHHVSLRGSDFERELIAFPKGHDDFVDALGFSMDLTGGGFFFGKLGGRMINTRR